MRVKGFSETKLYALTGLLMQSTKGEGGGHKYIRLCSNFNFQFFFKLLNDIVLWKNICCPKYEKNYFKCLLRGTE